MLDNAKFVQLFKYNLRIFYLGAFGILHHSSTSTGIFGVYVCVYIYIKKKEKKGV
jgi:hypothetical protein